MRPAVHRSLRPVAHDSGTAADVLSHTRPRARRPQPWRPFSTDSPDPPHQLRSQTRHQCRMTVQASTLLATGLLRVFVVAGQQEVVRLADLQAGGHEGNRVTAACGTEASGARGGSSVGCVCSTVDRYRYPAEPMVLRNTAEERASQCKDGYVHAGRKHALWGGCESASCRGARANALLLNAAGTPLPLSGSHADSWEHSP